MSKNPPNSNFRNAVFAYYLYKVVALCTGMAFAYMGYRLFVLGVFEKAGDLEHIFGKEHLLLKGASPGTFFALFGCAIIVWTISRGFNASTQTEESPNGFAILDQVSNSMGRASRSIPYVRPVNPVKSEIPIARTRTDIE